MKSPVGEENSCLHLDVGDGTITFTNKWLLAQLILHLQPHMSYRCVAPRLGTALYPSNGDLLKCLTHALYQCTLAYDMQKHCEDESIETEVITS